MRADRRGSSCCSAPIRRSERQVGAGKVQMFPRTEMLDLVVIDGKARGIVTRNLITGKIESHVADAVVLGTGGYGNVFLPLDQRQRLELQRRSGAPTSAARRSRIPASRRSTPPVFLSPATISRS